MNSRAIRRTAFGTLAAAGLWSVVAAPAAEAQVVADDVQCNQCVGKGDIADKAVTARKIKGNSVFSPKIIDRSIRGIDIGVGEIGQTEIATNGVASAEIANGSVQLADLASGIGTGNYQVVSRSFTGSLCGESPVGKPNCGILRTVACPAGKNIVGGGVANPRFGVAVIESHPQGNNGWEAWLMNVTTSTLNVTMTVQAICANVNGGVATAPVGASEATEDEEAEANPLVAAASSSSVDTRLAAVSGLWDEVRATSAADDDVRDALVNAMWDPDPEIADLGMQAADFLDALDRATALRETTD